MHSINKCTERPPYRRNNRHSWRSRVKIAQQTDYYKEAAHNRKLDPHSFLLGRCCTRKKCVGDERKSAHFKSIARVFPFPPTGSTGDSLYYETSPSAWRHSIRTSHFVVFVRKTKPVNRHQRVVEVKRYPSSHGWWAREGRRFTFFFFFFFFYRRINTITSHHAKLRVPNHNNNTRALFNVYPNCCPVALKIQPLRSNESRDHFSYIIIFVFFYDLDFFSSHLACGVHCCVNWDVCGRGVDLTQTKITVDFGVRVRKHSAVTVWYFAILLFISKAFVWLCTVTWCRARYV